ncbi:hypothetical protein ABS71_06200 [bacterium SCN 62-11]|nr:MAG: hypothetical protein ABS71_06200 [bacterium SCN 62-11]
MTPLSNNFTVSLAGATRPASTRQATPEFVVEVAQDGFQGSVVQGIAVEKDIIQAQPVVIEAQPEILQARPETPVQSPCQLTEPPHEDGWYLSH